MEVELSQNNKNNLFEIWVDNKFLKTIQRKQSESLPDYKLRAEREYDNYLSSLKDIKQNSNTKTIKKTTI